MGWRVGGGREGGRGVAEAQPASIEMSCGCFLLVGLLMIDLVFLYWLLASGFWLLASGFCFCFCCCCYFYPTYVCPTHYTQPLSDRKSLGQ